MRVRIVRAPPDELHLVFVQARDPAPQTNNPWKARTNLERRPATHLCVAPVELVAPVCGVARAHLDEAVHGGRPGRHRHVRLKLDIPKGKRWSGAQ